MNTSLTAATSAFLFVAPFAGSAGLRATMLILAALWWAWGAYAWLTNEIDPNEGSARLAVFASMAAMFVAALSVPQAFGADAVLYVTIEDWGQKYRIVSSDTVVRARAHLVDVATGETIWSGAALAQQSSASGQTDPFGMLLAALLTQVLSGARDPAYDLARTANGIMISDQDDGLLLGPRHPRAASDLRGR